MQPRSIRLHGRSELAWLLCCTGLLAACSTVRPPASTAPDAVGRPPAPGAPTTTPTPPRPASGAVALPPAGSGRGGYYLDDGPGEAPPPNLESIPDAIPKLESYSTRGNKPYVVFGKTYTPVTDNQPMKQRGMGSWYGKKFHGQKTSSGELYDMYKMTAAHPTLPIPSYARVTNLKNGAQVIVRVNDRGPFHSSRIIDLSYTAALKLGYVGHGSTELEVERLLPDDIARINAQARNPAPVVADTSMSAARPALAVPAITRAAVASPVLPALVRSAPAATDAMSLDDFLQRKASDSAMPAVADASAAAMIMPATLPAASPDMAPATSLVQPITQPPAHSLGQQSSQALSQSPSQPLSQSLGQPLSQPLGQSFAAALPVAGEAGAALTPGFYLQFGAYTRSVNADQLRSQLLPRWPAGVPLPEVRHSGTLYRVFSGPYATRESAANAAVQFGESPSGRPLIVPR